jgi:hypothetical protein
LLCTGEGEPCTVILAPRVIRAAMLLAGFLARHKLEVWLGAASVVSAPRAHGGTWSMSVLCPLVLDVLVHGTPVGAGGIAAAPAVDHRLSLASPAARPRPERRVEKGTW